MLSGAGGGGVGINCAHAPRPNPQPKAANRVTSPIVPLSSPTPASVVDRVSGPPSIAKKTKVLAKNEPRERASAGDVRGDVRHAVPDPRVRGIIQVTLGRVSAEGSRCPAGMTPRGRDRHAGGGFLVSITRERFEPRTGYPPRRPPDACTSLASASADASSSGETRGRVETGQKFA